MKTLYLVRHAKSSWADFSIRDIDRPLNKRGFRDAPFMAKMIMGRGAKPDQMVSSPANRALTTASYFATEFGIPINNIIQDSNIYEASPTTIMNIVSQFDAKWNEVFLFGHNPTFTDIANRFAKTYLSNVPTCGICKIESQVENWNELDPINSLLTEFHYPKQYFSE